MSLVSSLNWALRSGTVISSTVLGSALVSVATRMSAAPRCGRARGRRGAPPGRKLAPRSRRRRASRAASKRNADLPVAHETTSWSASRSASAATYAASASGAACSRSNVVKRRSQPVQRRRRRTPPSGRGRESSTSARAPHSGHRIVKSSGRRHHVPIVTRGANGSGCARNAPVRARNNRLPAGPSGGFVPSARASWLRRRSTTSSRALPRSSGW